MSKKQIAKVRRDELIRKEYHDMKAQHLTTSYIREVLAEKYFLDVLTISQIANQTGPYKQSSTGKE